MKKFLTSSTDPHKMSLMVRGLLVALIPVLMIVTGLTEAELQGVIDVIVNIIFALTAFVSAVQVGYGLARKIYLGRWSSADDVIE